MKTVNKGLLLLLILTIGTVLLFAQTETGLLTGTVKDATGAMVANAKVTVTNSGTGLARSTTSASNGIFSFGAMKPGGYMLVIEAPNFQKYQRQVQVSVGATIDISAQLVVGTSSTVVEVTAQTGAEVNTENQTLSDTVSSKQLQELPTSPSRNPYALVGTSGNVTEDTNSNRGAGYAINGMRSSSTAILLDGAENVDLFTATVGQTVPLDSVQEFSVLTNNFGAEYGRASGGVVNLVTKSGTNQFHGSAYEFNRISALSSNTYQNNADRALAIQDGTCTGAACDDVGKKSRFTRNVFGGAVGGPIIKNKLFFFNDIEWTRVRSAASLQLGVIDPGSYPMLAPTSQAFFSTYGKNLVSGATVTQKVPCAPGAAGNASSIMCDVLNFQVPANAGGGDPQNAWNEVGRVDWNISDKTTLTGRYAANHINYFDGTVTASPYVGYSTGESDFNQNYSLSLSHIFNANVINTTKVIYNRLNQLQGLSTAPIGPTLYNSSGVPNVTGTNATLVYPGYSPTTPGNAVPFGGPQNLYQFYDDLSITKGKHQIKIGGQYIQIRDNRAFGAYENATEYLGTSLNTAMANLLAGNIYQFSSAINPQGQYPCVRDVNTGALIQTPQCTLQLPVSSPSFNRNYHYNDMAFYGQDAWKIMPRLTLNLGLRWEYYGVQHNSNQALDSNFVLGPGANYFEQIRNGKVELAEDGGYFWKPQYGGFGPRIGFAFDVFGNGKTSIRGGYSIGYERNFGNVTYNAIQNPPNYGTISIQSNVDVPFTMPVYTANAGPLAGNTGSKAFLQVSQRAIDQNMSNAYAETWNFGFEQEVFRGGIVSVSYAGSHGVHLYDISNINPGTGGNPNGLGGGGTYLGDTHGSNRLNLGYTNMNYRSDNGYSHYNGLILGFKATSIGKTGLSMTANYTWSHALDNLSSTFTDGNAGNYMLGYIDPFDPSLNYGNSDFDVRSRFNVSPVWELPWGKGSQSAVVRQLVGGWSIGSNFAARTGSPFSIFDSWNYNGGSYPQWAGPTSVPTSGTSVWGGPHTSNTFNYITLPLDNTGNPVNEGVALGLPTCTGLYHTGCTMTTNGSGYPHRNQFWGPGYWNLDMQFLKNFKLTERFGLQFRTEMYNIFNHHNTYVVGGNLDVEGTNFIQTEKGGPLGYAGSSSDERRNIQLGLKLTF